MFFLFFFPPRDDCGRLAETAILSSLDLQGEGANQGNCR